MNLQRRIFFLFLLAAFALAGCNLPQAPTATQKAPTHTASPSAIPATPTRAATKTPLPPTPTATIDPNASSVPGLDILIEGSPEFRRQTIRSLTFYQQCAPQALAEADIYLEKIMEYDRSGMDVYTGAFQAAQATAFVEGYELEIQVYWFGGSIIHDARHRWQHLNGINTDWSALDLAGRESIEKDARGVQIEAMQACIGSISDENLFQAEHLLTYLKDMQSGKIPCDYCKVDYNDRDW